MLVRRLGAGLGRFRGCRSDTCTLFSRQWPLPCNCNAMPCWLESIAWLRAQISVPRCVAIRRAEFLVWHASAPPPAPTYCISAALCSGSPSQASRNDSYSLVRARAHGEADDPLQAKRVLNVNGQEQPARHHVVLRRIVPLALGCAACILLEHVDRHEDDLRLTISQEEQALQQAGTAHDRCLDLAINIFRNEFWLGEAVRLMKERDWPGLSLTAQVAHSTQAVKLFDADDCVDCVVPAIRVAHIRDGGTFELQATFVNVPCNLKSVFQTTVAHQGAVCEQVSCHARCRHQCNVSLGERSCARPSS